MRPLQKFAHPTLGFEGNIEGAVLYASESCSLINDIKSAAEIVRDFEREAEAALRGLWDMW
jgi:nitronate monooxygenase/enoyl-[acyl-carrier protein] reductase II